MRGLFDRTVRAQQNGGNGVWLFSTVATTGAVAAASASTILAFAGEGITVAFLVYTPDDPMASVGDLLNVSGVNYPVVAKTRPFVNGRLTKQVFVTPCGGPA